MSRFLLIIALILSVSATGAAQAPSYKGIPSLVWPKLYDISYTTAKDAFGEYKVPVFSEATKALEGDVITLPGYMVPFEGSYKGDHFILSSLPLNACFFCGVGGPESVIEVFLKDPIKYTDNPVEIRGKLRLNAEEPDQFMYILQDAEFLGELDF